MTSVQHSVTNGVHQMADSISSYQPASSSGNDLLQSDTVVDSSFEAVNQVAWAFIEQYYTNLGKNPDKIHLLYKSPSYFTCGHDGESTPCALGQTQIQERVNTLQFQDAKFRLSNIDAQPSDSCIVIQVIGDFCRTPGTAQRFVQTFVLARQSNGYYVLNDIFRSLNEVGTIVDDEPAEESKPVAEEAVVPVASKPNPEPTVEDEPLDVHANTAEPVASQPTADKADVAETEPEAVTDELDATVDQAPREEVDEAVSELPQPEEVEAPVTAEPEAVPEPEPETQPVEADVAPVEESFPAAPAATEPWKPRIAKESAAPAAAPKPSVPKTWASLAASANKSTSASKPAASTATTAAPAAVAPAASAVAAAPAPVTVKPTPAPVPAPAVQKPASITALSPAMSSVPAVAAASANGVSNMDSESDGWVAVGTTDSKRSRTNAAFTSTETRPEPEFRGYIKNVVASVSVPDLKIALAKFDVTYLDISRQKNCAFVDFGSHRALMDAINSSPYSIGEEQIYVEERRAPRTGFPPRHGAPLRHVRPGAQPTPRGGFNKEGRGSYPGRGSRGHSFRGRGQV